jgi:hypothetical protein
MFLDLIVLIVSGEECKLYMPEEIYVLEYNAFLSPESQSMFRRNIFATCFRAGFLLGLFFDHEDEGDMFLRNVD